MRSVKCVVIGDGAVGKTSLLISYTTNTFPGDYVPTVFDNYTTTISLRDPNYNSSDHLDNQDLHSTAISSHSNEHLKIFKLNLWDTAGQEEYDRLRPLSYPQTDIFLICFSVTERNSFRNVIDKWLPELKTNSNIENSEIFIKFKKYPILLVGTKSDLSDSINENDPNFISRDEINQIVQENCFMSYVECSAMAQTGVREVFEKAIDNVVFEPERLANKQKKSSNNLMNLTSEKNNNNNKDSHNINGLSSSTSKKTNNNSMNNKESNTNNIITNSTENKKTLHSDTRHHNQKNSTSGNNKNKKNKDKKKDKCIIM